MDFDLRTIDSAYSFVLNLLGLTGEEFVVEYVVECSRDFEQLWDKYYNQIKHIVASQIRIWAFHITGSLDNCCSIKREGLRNLHHTLGENAALGQMLKKYGVEFDISKKIMTFAGVEYTVDYEKYRNRFNLWGKDEHLSSIAHRLCKDYCVNGFMCNDNYLSYSYDVHIRPEFLIDLVELFPQLSTLDLEWREHSTSYKVNFYTYLGQLDRSDFELDEYRDPPYNNWCNLDDNEKIIKWMLGHAIDRAFDELSETYLYVRPDSFVPPEQIQECEIIARH